MTGTDGQSRKRQKPSAVMKHDPLAEFDDLSETPVPVDADRDAGAMENPVTTEAVLDAVSAMPSSMKESAMTDQTELDLGSSLTILDVGDWYQKMAGLCDAGGSISLKGGDIDQIDGAGVQLLAAFIKEAAHLQVAITWTSVSKVLAEAVGIVGLSDAVHISADS
jgi:anti-anti-sigma regulatory factor